MDMFVPNPAPAELTPNPELFWLYAVPPFIKFGVVPRLGFPKILAGSGVPSLLPKLNVLWGWPRLALGLLFANPNVGVASRLPAKFVLLHLPS